LPLLDGMVPAFAATGDAAAKPAVRLGFVYVPNGVIMEKWTPATEGTNFEITPILEPLAPFRDHLLVLSGFSNMEARRQPGEGGGDHPRASGAYLTGVHPKNRTADFNKGISVDQIAAKELGKHTQLASLEVSLDSADVVGVCDAGYSLAFTNTISWRGATTPMPMENQPRAVFERLFGDSNTTDLAARLTRIQERRSILDSVVADVTRLLTGLGPSDRARLTEYLEAIRDVERRIQMAEQQAASQELPTMERPVGVPATFEEHAKLIFDLQLLALQCDLTRVITFMMAREQSQRAYPEIGVPEPHHPLSHHGNKPEMVSQVLKIDIFHARMFAYYLEKLRSTPDGDGSLLDHSIIVYGSGMSNGSGHDYHKLPVLLAGGGAGRIKGGRHLRYKVDTPLTNLLLAVLDKLGIPMEKLGDSTGKVEGSSLS